MSFRQARRRWLNITALSAGYSVAAVAAVLALVFCAKSDGMAARTALGLISVNLAVIAVYMRGRLGCVLCRISSEYLSEQSLDPDRFPGTVPLVCGELAIGAATLSARAFCLAPSFVCFRYAAKYYLLSGDRRCTTVLLGASMALAAGGAVYSAMAVSRLSCAEWLWLSGTESGALAAMDASWEMTRGRAGELLCVRAASAVFGIAASVICRFNYTAGLIWRGALCERRVLTLSLVRRERGERVAELLTL